MGRIMNKLWKLAIFTGCIYWLGGAVYERYDYVSDRRAWLEEGRAMQCDAKDLERMAAGARRALLEPVQGGVSGNGLQARLQEIQFDIPVLAEGRLVGLRDQTGMPMCTDANYPWKPSKGGPNESSCTLPAYMLCSARIMVNVPADITKVADIASEYLPLPSAGSSVRTMLIEGREFEVFEIRAHFYKPVPRYARTTMAALERRDGTVSTEGEYLIRGVDHVLHNWIEFHENLEVIARNRTVRNDIGGAVGGGGYIGAINKLRAQQVAP